MLAAGFQGGSEFGEAGERMSQTKRGSCLDLLNPGLEQGRAGAFSYFPGPSSKAT